MPHTRYKPVKDKRFFGPTTFYSEIDWNDWSLAVGKFRELLTSWYLEPAQKLLETSHHSFASMSLACTLVDTLGQYYFGVEEGTKTEFKAFLDKHFPGFSKAFAVPILASHNGRTVPITTFSDALYHGFRCGIVHEAHVKLYTGIKAQDDLALYEPSGFTLYDDGTDCPTVIVDPAKFVSALVDIFNSYFALLLDMTPTNDVWRANFRRKFKWSYGIDIGNEP